MSPESAVDRLRRLAELDGLVVRIANTTAQRQAWGGTYALFEGEHFRYAGRVDSCRAWLYQQALVKS